MNYMKAIMNEPNALALELTYKCNLNCVYCTKREEGEGHKDIPTDLLNQLDATIGSKKRIIVCGIGESFLYPGLYNLISHFSNQKFCIVTNGTIIIDYERLNRFDNVEQIIYSIDAVDEPVLNKISGTYRLDNLLKNLVSMADYSNKHNKKINHVLNCTLNEYNLDQIIKLVEFAYAHKIGAIHFSLPRGREQFIHRHKDILISKLQEAKKLANKYGLLYVNPFDVCCVFYDCITPYITLDGNVYACAETLYKSFPLGNIYETPFEDIVQDKEYKDFQGGLSCKNCGFLQNTYVGKQSR